MKKEIHVIKKSIIYFVKPTLVALSLCFLTIFSNAQSITFDNVPPYGTGSTGVTNGGYVFNFSTNKAITLQNFRLVSSAATYTVTVWYNPVKVNGQPVIGNMNAAGGWISLGNTSHTGLGTGAIATIPLNLNLNMNPGDTFAFFIQQSAGNIYPTTNTTIPTYSNGTVTIIADASSAFARTATAWFTPRQFNGGVIYVERSLPFNNASVSALVSNKKFCGTTQDLRVKIANRGSNPISNVTVNWSIDGLLQTPVSLVTLLDTLNHPTNKNDTNITLGAISYTPGISKNIYVWTSLPNGVADTTTNDDSLNIILKTGLSGTYTISSTSADFSNFRDATNAIDSLGKCGPLVFNVTAGEIFKSAPVSISNLDSITFQKFGTGANPIVYGVGGVGVTDAVFRIAGSKNILFDGIDVADSISNAANTERMEYGYSVINAGATNGSSNNIIKNCKITLNRLNTASFGIVQSTTATAGGVAASSLAGGNHNNRYENVKIENVYKGIGLIGTPGFPDSNCVVTSTGGDTTIVGANTPNDIGNGTLLVYGISAADQKNVEISKCLVRNLSIVGSSTVAMQGIFIDNGSTTVNYGTARVWGNTIFNVSRVSTSTGVSTATHVHGIRVDASTTAAAQVWNNVVHSITSVASGAAVSANQMVRGISFGTTTGTGTADFYHNSVLINNPALNSSSVAFWKGGGGSTVVRNNIFSNTSPAQTGIAKHYAAYVNAGTIASSHNILWSPNANGFVGFITSDRASLPSFAAATSPAAPTDGNEQGSANADPNFASASNLDFAGTTPAVSGGVPVNTPIAITTDIAGNLRSASAPTIGAFETTQPLFDSSAPVIRNVVVSSGVSPSVYATISDNSAPSSAGNISLWYRLGNSGSFISVSPDSLPTGTMNGTYKWAASINSLPTGLYQFYIAARDIVGAGLNIAVNPVQSTAFTSFNSFDPVNYATNPDAGVNTRTFSKTAILTGGVYSVGASSAPYLKLTDVANTLSSAELTGNVIFELQSDYDGTVGESFPITFNQLITTGGNWTATIRPAATVVGRETSGYPASGVPIINLNGADRIIFDGRPGGIGSTSAWTIRAKRTSVSSNSPCILLDNGAQRNLFQHLTVEADNTTATSGAILIGSTANTDGNSFNRIFNNTISSRTDSVGLTAVGIYSAGTLGSTNDSNIINNNSLVNWATTGINVTATGNGANWQINNNQFYMITAQTTAQTAVRFEAGANASSTRINGNVIGGTTVNAGSAAWTNSGNIAWRGIVCTASTTDSVQIQNNTIQNINLTGVGAGTYAAIEMTGALASIRNNTIGHPTTPNSIQTSQLGTIISIWLNNANNRALIEGNTIANVNSTGNTTAVGHNGMRITTAVTTAPLIIRNNNINNLSALNPSTSSTTASMVGILSVYAGTQQLIEQNTIFNLLNSAQVSTNVFGINVTNSSGAGTIAANRIYGLNNTSNTATSQVVGIHLDLGSAWNVVNNMVALGNVNDSSAIFTGIQDKTAGTNHNIMYNTVLVSGNAFSTAATVSNAYRRTTTASTNIRNNIFSNERTGGTANYAIANTASASGWRANYNNLYSASSAQLGLWATTATDFTTWKTTSLHDTSSINAVPTFVSNIDLHLTAPTIGNTAFAALPIAGLTTDFDGQLRDMNTPYMGADEIPGSPLPVQLVDFTARKKQKDVLLNWSTATEVNASHFEVERSDDGRTFGKVGEVNATGNSTTLNRYQYQDIAILEKNSTLYYRLKIVDANGRYEYSKTLRVLEEDDANGFDLSVFPNPFSNTLSLAVEAEASGDLQADVFDLTGKAILSIHKPLSEGHNIITIDELSTLQSGLYFISISNGNSKHTIKISKQ